MHLPAFKFMRTKQQCIADAIAKKIMANTRRRFSTLHAEALEEFQMSNPDNTANMNVGQNAEVRPVTVKPTGFKTLEGSTPGDFRAQAAQPDPLKGNDTAPRGETNDSEGAGA